MSLVQTIQPVHAASDPPVTVMQDNSTGTGWGIYSTRPVLSEYVGSSSVLVSKKIDSITVNIKKSATSATGTAQIGIINPDLSMKKVFATISISSLTTSYTPYEYKLPTGESYVIGAGDRIGVKNTGGTSSANYLAIMRDNDSADPYDGANTYLSYYTTSWTPQTTYDLTMTLKYYGGGIDTTPPTVTASPIGGIFNTLQIVNLSSNEPATTIYYTLDNTTPTTSSSVYSTTISISATATLKFFGVDTYGNAGSVISHSYTIDSTPPIVTASPAGGSFTSEQSITLSSSESGTTIRYTVDGSVPSSSSPAYTSPIELSSDTTLKFFGKDVAGNSGTVGTESYFITLPDITSPTLGASPTGGTFGPSGTSVEITASEPATIYYTIDNTIPDTSSSIYSSSIKISATTTLKFFGKDVAGNSGSISTEIYTIDSIAPTVAASPAAGLYTSSRLVTLSASETGTSIYYTLDGTDPETTSPAYVGPISLDADVTLKFYGIDLAGNIGPITMEVYDFEIANNLPPDGVVQIYPTKSGGDEWYINMDNPASDPRFKPKVAITKNTDGSWKAKSTQVRANVFTVTGYSQAAITTYNQLALAEKGYMQSPNDWKNVEVTGYIKVKAYNKDDNFSWYGRGGMHTSSTECEGTAYKGNLYYSGKVRFAKEQWHEGGYYFTSTKTVTSPIKDKWVGFKFVMYNTIVNQGNSDITGAKLENWIDANNSGNWIKVDEKLDPGGWGVEGDHCGGSPDQIITWGGPVVTFRWDNTTDVDFKNFSVREIVPPQ